MKAISHRAHHRANLHGGNVLPKPVDIADDPDMQQTIKRIGENVGEVADNIDREQYILSVVSVVRAARAAR